MIRKMYKKIVTIIVLACITVSIFFYLLFPRTFHLIYTMKTTAKLEEIKSHYGVIIDAGSSGSRLFIYTWSPHSGNSDELLKIRPLLDSKGLPIMMKVNPGLSAMADHPIKVISYIRPLLDLAAKSIPKSQHKETPFYLMATAGMRMISVEAQNAILENVRGLIRKEYNFLFADSHVKVITGQEEGIFGWITTNYLLGRFNHNHSDGVPIIPVLYGDSAFRSKQIHHRKRTVGVIDLGGGSMQIAYELDQKSGDNSHSALTFNLGCKENDFEHTYKVFVTTFLGFGANSARTRYERVLVRDQIDLLSNGSMVLDQKQLLIEDACLHKGSQVSKSVKVINDTQGGLDMSAKQIGQFPSIKVTFKGTGKYHKCESRLVSILNKQPCPTVTGSETTKTGTTDSKKTSYSTATSTMCTMSGRVHPAFDLSNTQFYGFSEFWYSMYEVLGLGGSYNFFRLHSRAVDHCSKDWYSVSMDYKRGIYKNADLSRMKYQCFKSAWVTNILHTGLGFPNAFNKFTSVQEINGAEVQWSLGALLYQTRYFPLRSIEKQERELKRRHKEIRNHKNHMYMYLFLFISVSAVISTLIWMHNRQKWSFCWFYKFNQRKTTIYRRYNSADNLCDSASLVDSAQTKWSLKKNVRSVLNFKGWV